ncbi:methyl-accepting chemotaxis protein [Amphibacillus jilinensis]|uniref:methyl-accepting chemotaxis protein n=1 Tax=Amphibacillus jilinensis TaxID=1216008 RepID=UPI0002FD954B|nr:HAMP domain-containing methyl-accepting chemotaxis protein [Amphibacillus jilinensis]
MKIKGKLIVSYLSIAGLLLVIAVTAYFSLQNVYRYTQTMYQDRVHPLGRLTEVIQLGENVRVQMLSGVVEEDQTRASNALENIEQINGLLDQFDTNTMQADEVDVFESMLDDWNAYSQSVEENASLIMAGDFEEASLRIVVGGEFFNTFSADLQQLRDINLEIAGEDYNNSASTYEIIRLVILAISVAAVVVAIGLGIYMGQAIGGPLGQLSIKMKGIARGDLRTDPLLTKRKDEIGELVGSANQMQSDLQKVIHSVASATDQVSSASEELTQSAGEVREGSEQIASTMQELSTGGETQASTVTLLSEKMEQFVKMITDANSNTNKVSNESQMVLEKTDEGFQMMEQSIQQMMTIDQIVQDAVQKVEGLDKRSQDISRLVDVIHDIAEQTNLLALNAAIEAARAGEHGKGFAVVADEVRKLAEDVSSSVREITTIIDGIQTETTDVVKALETGYKEVNQGTTQMAKTGENFTSINDSISLMDKVVKKVATNLSEITQESAQINESIEEIASISEQSAAGIEETAASSEQSLSSMEEISNSATTLAELAEGLSKEVSHFKTT